MSIECRDMSRHTLFEGLFSLDFQIKESDMRAADGSRRYCRTDSPQVCRTRSQVCGGPRRQEDRRTALRIDPGVGQAEKGSYCTRTPPGLYAASIAVTWECPLPPKLLLRVLGIIRAWDHIITKATGRK